jgi:8-oxo-dGTP pyrophosphatase MutT (NUDIX family)
VGDDATANHQDPSSVLVAVTTKTDEQSPVSLERSQVKAHAFPVSVKGVAVQGGRVLLLQNERDEWELPGGKLELGEDPAACVVREISEESGWQVTAGPLLDCWQYNIGAGQDVLIVTYGCHVLSDGPPVVSHEHKQAGLLSPDAIPGLAMPDGYKRSIGTWLDRQRPPMSSDQTSG